MNKIAKRKFLKQ